MRVYKDQIITEIAKETGLTKWRTKLFLKAFAGVIFDHMLMGDEVNINRFGTFYVTRAKEKHVKNLITNGEKIIPERNKIRFKPGIMMKEEGFY